MTNDKYADIKVCLNCKKPKCTNCLGQAPTKKPPTYVVQIDPITEKELAWFNSAVDASRETGINYDAIRNALMGLSRTSGGYIWKKYQASR